MYRMIKTLFIVMMPLTLIGGPAMLDRPNGKIAYTIHGVGSTLVIAMPGMGDTQNQYRYLTPILVDAGYQVATIDLRGHGNSSLVWPDYSSAANGSDVVALIDELGAKNVILVGNSIGGAMSVWVAAERPDVINGIVMVNPFVEDGEMKWIERIMFKALFAKPWGKSSWLKFYKSNYPSQKPEDFDSHLVEIKEMLSRPGGYDAFRATIWSSHAKAATRIPEVKAPVMVIFGSKDPDYKDPQAEMEKLQKMFDAQALMIEGAGHYPHAEFPEITNPAIIDYIKGITHDKETETQPTESTE